MITCATGRRRTRTRTVVIITHVTRIQVHDLQTCAWGPSLCTVRIAPIIGLHLELVSRGVIISERSPYQISRTQQIEQSLWPIYTLPVAGILALRVIGVWQLEFNAPGKTKIFVLMVMTSAGAPVPHWLFHQLPGYVCFASRLATLTGTPTGNV